MSKRTPRNIERSTRSVSKQRSASVGSEVATPNAGAPDFADNQPTISQPRNKNLPSRDASKMTPSRENKALSESQRAKVKLPTKHQEDLSVNTSSEIEIEKPSQGSGVGSDNSQSEDLSKVGDNKDSNPSSGDNKEGTSPPALSNAEKTLLQVLADLNEIKITTAKLHTIEKTTADLSKDIQEVIHRTSELEEVVESSTARIRELGDEVSTLKTVATKQEKAISSLKNMKNEISRSNEKAVKQMTDILESQREQVASFQANYAQIAADIKAEIREEMKAEAKKSEEEIAEVIKAEIREERKAETKKSEQESHFQALTQQAFRNRFNLIITGLTEDPQKETLMVVQDFLKDSLHEEGVNIHSALRIGTAPEIHSKYARPVLLKFRKLHQRNLIWKKRTGITGDAYVQKTRIQADLPKELREGIQQLYTVAKAAAKLPQFQSAKVVDYQLELDGIRYLPSQLESLPKEIRPSSLSSPRSESSLVFFTGQSILSNHHPSEFTLEGLKYFSMEQYLAVKRAKFSGQENLIQKALRARDPKFAKYLLNALKGDQDEEWYQGIEQVLLDGLRAKFFQNPTLKNFLMNTHHLQLGEASKDPRWGIGLTLDDENVLDQSKWLPQGNLLGNSLMTIREEIRAEISLTTE